MVEIKYNDGQRVTVFKGLNAEWSGVVVDSIVLDDGTVGYYIICDCHGTVQFAQEGDIEPCS